MAKRDGEDRLDSFTEQQQIFAQQKRRTAQKENSTRSLDPSSPWLALFVCLALFFFLNLLFFFFSFFSQSASRAQRLVSEILYSSASIWKARNTDFRVWREVAWLF